MFGLSSMELLIIVVLALIFVGPDQLPKVARTLGKGLRQFRGAMDRVDGEVRRVVREASAEFDDLGRPIRETLEDATREDAAEAKPAAEGSTELSPAEDPHAAFKPAPPKPDDDAPPSPLPVSDEESAKAFEGAAARFADRDWSQIGKRPVQGQVARRPVLPTTPSPQTPVADGSAPATPALTPDSSAPTRPAPTAADAAPSATEGEA